MQVTLVMAYYENFGMLQEHYRTLRALPAALRDQINVVIVDDGSPNKPATAEDLNGVALQIYAMKEDIRWNQDACRNVGVKHAETNWILLTDMDHLVPEKTWAAVIAGKLDANFAYTFGRVSAPEMSPYKPHPNSYLMHRDKYYESGQYDERFAGFYGTDNDFRKRLTAVVKGYKMFKQPLIRYPRTLIPDASTTNYLRKQPEDRATIAKLLQDREAKGEGPQVGRFEYVRIYPK